MHNCVRYWYDVFVCNKCIVAKRCKIGSRLLLSTNRKLHIAFQITQKSLTLDDLEDQYALLWLNGKRCNISLVICYGMATHRPR